MEIPIQVASASPLVERRGTVVEQHVEFTEDVLQWGTVADLRTSQVAGLKDAKYDASTQKLYASHRAGILLWSWEKGQFQNVLATDKNEIVYAILPLGDEIWASVGKGKISIYDMATDKFITKFIAHSAEIVCMIQLCNTGAGKVLTGGMDFAVKIWDGDGILVSQSSHHHGTVVCALQTLPKSQSDTFQEGDEDCVSPTQVWTGSADGTVFSWVDADSNGKMDTDEGKILRHSSGEGITCLQEVEGYIWAGTEKGKLIVWDAASLQVVCELPGAHRDRITSICGMGDTAWSSGSDKVISVWDARLVTNKQAASTGSRLKLLFTLNESIGYVKHMVRINWALWVFHSKGMSVYSSASNYTRAKDDCAALMEQIRSLHGDVDALEEEVGRQKTVEGSLQHKLGAITSKQSDTVAKLRDVEEKLAELQQRYEDNEKDKEKASADAAKEIQSKEERIASVSRELEAVKQQMESMALENKDELENVRKEHAEDKSKIIESARRDKEELQSEIRSKAIELESSQRKVEGLERDLSREKEDRDREWNSLSDKHDSVVKEAQEGQIQLAHEKENAEKDLEEKILELKTLEKKFDELSKDSESKSQNFIRLEKEFEELSKDSESKSQNIIRLEKEFEELSKDSESKSQNIIRLEKEFDELSKDSESKTQNIAQLEKQGKETEGRLAELKQALDDKDTSIASKNTEIDSLQSRVEDLEESSRKSTSEMNNLKEKFLVESEAGSKTHQEALSKIANEKEAVEANLTCRIKELEEEKTNLINEKEMSLQEMQKKVEKSISEGVDRSKSLQEQLQQSKTAYEAELKKTKKQNESLLDEVQDLRGRHAKTLLLAGTKHQQLLNRNKKELDETQNLYSELVESHNAELATMREKHAEESVLYEKKMKDLEESHLTREKEKDVKMKQLSEHMEEKQADWREQLEQSASKNERLLEQMQAFQREREEEMEKERVVKEAQKNEVERLRESCSSQEMKLKESARKYEDDLREQSAKCDRVGALCEKSELELEDLRHHHKELQQSLERSKREMDSTLQEAALKDARFMDQLQSMGREREEERRKCEEELEAHRKEMEKLAESTRKQEKKLRETIAKHEDELREQQAKCDRAEELSESNKSLQQELDRIQQTCKELKGALRQQKRKHDEVETLYENTKEELSSLEESRSSEKKEILEAHRTAVKNLMDEKMQLEKSIAQYEEEMREILLREDRLKSQVLALKGRLDKQEEQKTEYLAIMEKLAIGLGDIGRLAESSCSTAPLSIGKALSLEGNEILLYVQSLKQDLSGLILKLKKDISELRHQTELQRKRTEELQSKSTTLENLLEIKRKKKRKWKMAYLRLSATQAEEITGLKNNLEHMNEKLQTQQALYNKSNQALRQAAYQLHQAKELEGALDQSQKEYASLLSKMSSIRQQSEYERNSSQDTIMNLHSQLEDQERLHEQAVTRLREEIRHLGKIAPSLSGPSMTAKKHLVESTTPQHGQLGSNLTNSSRKEKERYSGFVC